MTMKQNGTFKYLAALLLFGSNGIVAGCISLNSRQIVFLRTCIGSLLLLLVFCLSGRKFTFFRHRRALAFLALSGMSMGASWMLLYEAYDRIGVGIASILYYCGPVIVMALSPVLFRERLTKSKAVGFLLVLGGLVLINAHVFSGSGDVFGILCGLLSAVFYAGMVICNKKAAAITGFENSLLQLCVAFLTVAVFVGVTQGIRIPMKPSDILPALVLGVLNTGIGCYLYFSSIGQLNVQSVAVLGYLEPLSAVLFSAVLLKERMQPLQMAGAVCMLCGAVICECGAQVFDTINLKKV